MIVIIITLLITNIFYYRTKKPEQAAHRHVATMKHLNQK